jgi:hypothetical protein
MSDYRDDLAAAHRRIALLEEALGQRPPPMPVRRRPILAIVIGVLVLGFYLCVFGALSGRWMFARPVPPPVPVEPSPATPQRLYASWYTQSGVLPTMVDVDGDGTKDIVGLFWRSGEDATALHVAAVNGKTFALAWTAGPFASQWSSTRTHLAVAGNKVVVTDSQDWLHVLELGTGKELTNQRLEGGVLRVCAAGNGNGRFLVQTSAAEGSPSGARDEERIFDADTSSFAAAPPGLACAVRYDTCSAEKKGRPCFHYGAAPSAPKDAVTTPSFYVSRTVEDGTTAITVGSAAAGSGRAAPQLIGFTKGARKAAWRTPLLPEGDEVHYGVTQSELRDGRLTAFYQTKKGPFRLVSRDALSGALLWSATVPRSDEGSYAAAFGVEDGRVLVVMNETVHIFDAATGEYLKGLDSSTI